MILFASAQRFGGDMYGAGNFLKDVNSFVMVVARCGEESVINHIIILRVGVNPWLISSNDGKE
ncbi:MAG TPA: hypothetical protein VKR53_10575 [Puia sp.]|nr:hypothetical protein [Puia sp.]